jgi:hypothetical protein
LNRSKDSDLLLTSDLNLEPLSSIKMSNTCDQYIFGHFLHPGTHATSAPPVPASVLSVDTQGDRGMRDAEPAGEDPESTRFPTSNPTPPSDPTASSDPLPSAPTLARQLDLTPVRNGAYLSMPAWRNLLNTEGNEIVTPARFG